MSTSPTAQTTDTTFSGLVSYAMPHSCLLSGHFSQLLRRREQTPGIELDVTIQSSLDVLDSVRDGRVDFGFVTQLVPSPSLTYIPFCCEEYVLAANRFPAGFGISEETIGKAGFIGFPGCENYAHFWLHAAFGANTGLDYEKLRKTGECNSIDGAILMVTGGLGISFFPRHTIMGQLEGHLVQEFPLEKPVTNQIYIVYDNLRGMSPHVKMIIEWFREMEP